MDYTITKAKCGICNFERPYDLLKEVNKANTEIFVFSSHVCEHFKLKNLMKQYQLIFCLIDQELSNFENHVKTHRSESGGTVIFSSKQQMVKIDSILPFSIV